MNVSHSQITLTIELADSKRPTTFLSKAGTLVDPNSRRISEFCQFRRQHVNVFLCVYVCVCVCVYVCVCVCVCVCV
jgi:hypothetical protein